jgi:hypothetical protein
MSADKQQILETITAVSRLITLSFKPKDTKIAIRDHKLVLCEPESQTLYGFKIAQGIERYWNRDSREDIYVLNHVICNFIEWYVMFYKKEDPEIYKGLINITKYLCVSLRNLQRTYRSGNVVGTLQYYIIVLTAVIDDSFHPDMLYSLVLDGQINFNEDNDDVMYSTIFDIDKFKNFWKKDELKSLCSQFDKCFKMPDEPELSVFNEDSESDIKGKKENTSTSKISNQLSQTSPQSKECPKDIDIENIYEPKRESKREPSESTNTRRKLSESSESNQQDNNRKINKVYPVPRNQNNVIVQGHLVGITNILNMMDKRFTSMLNQSVKGTH